MHRHTHLDTGQASIYRRCAYQFFCRQLGLEPQLAAPTNFYLVDYYNTEFSLGEAGPPSYIVLKVSTLCILGAATPFVRMCLNRPHGTNAGYAKILCSFVSGPGLCSSERTRENQGRHHQPLLPTGELPQLPQEVIICTTP